MHENRETSEPSADERERIGLRRLRPYDKRERDGGVGLSRSTDEPTEQRRVDGRRLECGGWAEAKAAYRFFQNENVDVGKIMATRL